MKILKIFGIVVGIHVFALILIFANPGCSSTTKPAPSAADTVASAETAPAAAPMITVPPATGGGTDQLAGTPVTPAAGSDSAAIATGSESTSGVRFSPTRPNTPAASAVLRGKVENVTPATTYTVKKGDSLWSVAHKFHVSTKEITAANNLRSGGAIRPGQKLIIPSKTPAASKAAAAPTATGAAAAKTASSPSTRPTSQEFKYKVKSGETLGGIAHKFGVPVSELAVQNNISDPMKLRAGTELVIPGWKPTAGSSSGSKASTSHERRGRGERTERGSEAAPAPAAPEATPSTAPAQPEQPAQVPNLLEPSPAQPAPSESTPSTTVPVIDIGGQDSSTPSATSTPSQ